MYIIQKEEDLNVLKNAKVMNSDYLNQVEKQFINLYENLGGEQGVPLEQFTLQDKGYIVILQKGDNFRNLSIVGLDEEGGLLEATPEFINKIDLEYTTIYEIVIVYNNEFAMTFYISKDIVDEEIIEWIDNYKWASNLRDKRVRGIYLLKIRKWGERGGQDVW